MIRFAKFALAAGVAVVAAATGVSQSAQARPAFSLRGPGFSVHVGPGYSSFRYGSYRFSKKLRNRYRVNPPYAYYGDPYYGGAPYAYQPDSEYGYDSGTFIGPDGYPTDGGYSNSWKERALRGE